MDMRIMNFKEVRRWKNGGDVIVKVYSALLNYATTDLSQFYLDLVKDRLYNGSKDGLSRRSAQTTLFHVGDNIQM